MICVHLFPTGGEESRKLKKYHSVLRGYISILVSAMNSFQLWYEQRSQLREVLFYRAIVPAGEMDSERF
jgi:hypothetical protein